MIKMFRDYYQGLKYLKNLSVFGFVFCLVVLRSVSVAIEEYEDGIFGIRRKKYFLYAFLKKL